MSFILDALKKSETERQEQRTSEFSNVPSSTGSARAPRWLWVLAALLAFNLAVLVGLLLRDDTPAIGSAVVDTPPAPPASEPSEPGAAQGTQANTSFASKIEQARDRQTLIARAEQLSTPTPQPGPADEQETPPAEPGQFTLSALPTASELISNGTLQMAELHLDIHVYSEKPGDRFVFINMVRHKENSKLAEGPIVQEITPEGVILDYRGTRFLLPRD